MIDRPIDLSFALDLPDYLVEPETPRKLPAHYIADISYRDTPNYTVCSCGKRYESMDPEELAGHYNRHTGTRRTGRIFKPLQW